MKCLGRTWRARQSMSVTSPVRIGADLFIPSPSHPSTAPAPNAANTDRPDLPQPPSTPSQLPSNDITVEHHPPPSLFHQTILFFSRHSCHRCLTDFLNTKYPANAGHRQKRLDLRVRRLYFIVLLVLTAMTFRAPSLTSSFTVSLSDNHLG